MKASPLVSVVCLCYNHASYVKEAVKSVFDQTYANLEVIIVDDCSTDNSAAEIDQIAQTFPQVKIIKNETNLGNCSAFNIGFKASSGDFLIDLAADDMLLPTRIEEGIKSFEEAGAEFGVNYCDYLDIDENGESLQKETNFYGVAGNLYEQLIERYMISAPTMLIKRKVLEDLNGYDETLAYEDFDFWVRSARNWKYCYINQKLVKKRKLSNSLGESQYRFGSPQMRSTFIVCQKILKMNQSVTENKALRKRIGYEFKHCLARFNWKLCLGYVRLYLKTF